MAENILAPQSPFEGLAAVATGQGVTVSDREGVGLSTILVRKGQAAALAACVKDRFGIELPCTPRRVSNGRIAFIATGPESWLAVGEDCPDRFSSSLRDAVGAHAAVVDQSDGYAVLRVSGPKVRDTLAKGVPIDLHARAFRTGDVAGTVVSHIGVTLWRLDDREDGAPVFEIIVFRSLAGSFWDWLAESSAEFGLTVLEPCRI
jgi:sarcosine oxidase subunit gamma